MVSLFEINLGKWTLVKSRISIQAAMRYGFNGSSPHVQHVFNPRDWPGFEPLPEMSKYSPE